MATLFVVVSGSIEVGCWGDFDGLGGPQRNLEASAQTFQSLLTCMSELVHRVFERQLLVTELKRRGVIALALVLSAVGAEIVAWAGTHVTRP